MHSFRTGIGACVIAAAMLSFLVSCSAFDQQWRQLKNAPPPADPILGAWEGRWSSATTGHEGRIRAIIAPRADNHYEAWYAGVYGGLLPFNYKVIMEGTTEDGQVRFSGEKDLGRMAGGVYHYQGVADGQEFRARYVSAKDEGRFEMARPE